MKRYFTVILTMAFAALFLAACQQAGGGGGDSGGGGTQPEAAAAPPSAPGQPELRPLDGALDALWDQVSGAAGYTLYYGTGSDPDAATLWAGTIDALWGVPARAQITGLTNGEVYHVWVKARNAAGQSDYSPPAEGTPAAGADSVPPLFFDLGRRVLSTDGTAGGTVTVSSGQRYVLAPVCWRMPGSGVTWKWTLDGVEQSGQTTAFFDYPWSSAGATHTVTVSAAWGNRSASATVQVNVVSPRTAAGRTNPGANPMAALYEFMPAPGQFVGVYPRLTGFPYTDGAALTAAAAAATAADKKVWQFSLGSYGGYVITKFDHSVTPNPGGYDISAKGNAFGNWHEPGIVWVAQDADNDGQPDAWFELKGSAKSNPAAWRQRYAVLWNKPAGAYGQWRDSVGGQDTVTYGSSTADFRYPAAGNSDWILMSGSRLDRYAMNLGTDWGYVDIPSKEHFRIGDAIQADGSPANLTYIDFVKIQCAPFEDAGQLGEISTETGFPIDLAMPGALPTVQGKSAGNGQYEYTFLNDYTGYNLYLSVDGGAFEEFKGMGTRSEKSFTSTKAVISFDYYGGNLEYAVDNAAGTVTFGAVPYPNY